MPLIFKSQEYALIENRKLTLKLEDLTHRIVEIVQNFSVQLSIDSVEGEGGDNGNEGRRKQSEGICSTITIAPIAIASEFLNFVNGSNSEHDVIGIHIVIVGQSAALFHHEADKVGAV